MSMSFNTFSAISASFLIAGIATAQTAGSGPVDLVDALNGVFGKHAGVRASHAKGICVVGSFTPNPQAASLTSASFLTAKKIPLTGRFSVGGGNPKASDKGKTVRGLALRFGDVQQPALDLVLLSAPVFMVATPEEFVGFMKARVPDPTTGKPDPVRIKAFNDANPSTKAQIEFLNNAPITPSYAQAPYWGVNAFRFISASKQTSFGRWRAEPVAGRGALTADQLSQLPDDFLAGELTIRLGNSMVEFDLMVQIANRTDDTRNPTVQWPAGNTQINLGRIQITGVQTGCENVMFNPAQLPSGIALSDDPTLLARAGSYAVSLGIRTAK